MSSFLEIALPLAEHGFRVFPLVPEDKRPVRMSWGDHFDAATTDRAPLEQWSRECPRANVGISPDENFCFLETDDEAALRAACADITHEVWDTTRVSARSNRCYYIFRQTMRTRKAGNMTKTRGGQENLFEFKQHRVYVTGPGSIHPKTGKPYGVEWRTIPAMPDVLLNRLCELYGAPKVSESHAMSEETKRQTELLDRFLATYEVGTTGDWFNKGKQWYRPVECPWRDVHENTNEGTSTCIVYTEGDGYGFDCKHRCACKGWKEFRAELERRFPDRKFSFVSAEEVGTVAFGGESKAATAGTETLDPPKLAEKHPRPDFPDESWDGTIYGAFADILCRDTFIRKRLASEAFRGITGALAGDQVRCGVSGVRLREFIAILALAQSGKSYGLDRAIDFYTLQPPHKTFVPMLMLCGGANEYRPSAIGAQRFLPGSANSFVDELTREEKREQTRKKDKEEIKDTEVLLHGKNILTPPVNPEHLIWKPTARLITLQGEAMSLFSRMCSPDWTGQALSALVTDLYDSLDAEVAVTKDRAAPKKPIQVQYSMVLCTQPQIWRKHMAAHMMDSGLFGRFYIVGTETKPQKVMLPDYSDPELFESHFGALRRDVFARLQYLQRHPLLMTVALEAKRRLQEWENALPEDEDMGRDLSSRMGLHVWRAAMARAWGAMPQRTEITLEDADAAIRLGEFQVKMRQYYAPTPGDSPRWKHLNAVRAAIEQAGQITVRELRLKVKGDHFPEDFDWALDYLEKRGYIVRVPAPRKRVLVSWVLDREG